MRARRTDENQKAVVSLLRSAGFSVRVTSEIGEGFPDLVAARDGINYLLEIKDPEKSPSRRKLTEAQEDFHATWKGSIMVINSEARLLKFIRGK